MTVDKLVNITKIIIIMIKILWTVWWSTKIQI
jgi:hypothetical protein